MKTTGLKRNNNEQYYTKENLANTLVNKVDEICSLNSFDYILEPSAGKGAFLTPLQNFENILAYDIDPKHPSIIKADFLKQQFNTNKRYLVIGNPPFGRQSSLAKQFIKHSCEFAEVIAFILPRSFKKFSMQKCFRLNFHKIYEEELEHNSFVYETKEYSVPCVFQIWNKKDFYREILEKVFENNTYKIVKKTNNPDFAFRRVGVYAGKFLFEKLDILSSESHYFIKVETPIETQTIVELKLIEWDTDNTTGPKSISKQELITQLNVIF